MTITSLNCRTLVTYSVYLFSTLVLFSLQIPEKGKTGSLFSGFFIFVNYNGE